MGGSSFQETFFKMIDPKILSFIKKHHVFTLASCIDNTPYTASCFYVFNVDLCMFIFTSNMQTRHAQQILLNSKTAGNIVLETSVIGKLQGLQFTGSCFLLNGELLKKATHSFLLRFPFVVLTDNPLWGFSPDFMKFTDNRLGFGKKLIWEKEVNH